MSAELKVKFEQLATNTGCFPPSSDEDVIDLMQAAYNLGKADEDDKIQLLVNQMINSYTQINEGGKVAVCKRILNHFKV